MKKLSILGLCLLAVASASAQKSLVKEAEGKAKAGNDYPAVRSLLAPAMTNEETKNDPQTWYVAGLIEFKDYDNIYGRQAVGQGKDGDQQTMGKDLLKGYEYYMTALPLDSIVEMDKNGNPKLNKDGSPKIKTKYSKDIVKTLASHYGDYISGGQYLWDAKDYDGAYKLWDIYTSMPTNKALGSDAPKAPNDTVLGEINYFKGLAAWQAEKLPLALTAFDQAISYKYTPQSLFDYAISVAAQADNNAKVVELATLANEIHGDSISTYLTIIINDKINNQQYEDAQRLLEKAISVTPDNAELYDVMGILYQSQNNLEKAREYLEKAVALKPDFAKAQLDLGRVIFAQGAAIDEANVNLPAAEYNKMRAEKVDPILKEAIPYLENALKDDNTMSEARRILRSVYYSLGDEANLQRIEAM